MRSHEREVYLSVSRGSPVSGSRTTSENRCSAKFSFVTVRFYYWRGSDGRPINHMDLVFSQLRDDKLSVSIYEPRLIKINNFQTMQYESWWAYCDKRRLNVLHAMRNIVISNSQTNYSINILFHLYYLIPISYRNSSTYACVELLHFFSRVISILYIRIQRIQFLEKRVSIYKLSRRSILFSHVVE